MAPPPKKQIKKLPVPALGPKQALPQPIAAPGIRQQLPDKSASPIRQQLPNKPVSSGPLPPAQPNPGAPMAPNMIRQPGPLTKTNIRQPQPNLGPRNNIRQPQGGLPGGRPSTGHGQGVGKGGGGAAAPPPGPAGVGTGGTFGIPGVGGGKFNKPGIGTGGTFSLNGEQVGTFNDPETGPMSLQDKLDAYAAKLEAERNAPMATDSIYGAEMAGSYKNLQDQITAANLQEQNLAQEYGFGAEYQQGGAKYNPYSRAAQLSAAWERDRRGIINSAASSGQLYAGSMQNADNYAQADYLGNVNDARNEERMKLGELAAQRTGAVEGFQSDYIDALKSNMERGLESRPDEAPPPPAFVKEAKNLYKERLDALKNKRDDAKNKVARQKVTKKIKKIKKKLGSIPSQYEEV